MADQVKDPKAAKTGPEVADIPTRVSIADGARQGVETIKAALVANPGNPALLEELTVRQSNLDHAIQNNL